MNLKQFIIPSIVLLAGFAFSTVGALFKVMHWQFANEVFIFGTVLKVVAIVLAIIQLIKVYRSKG